jgi:hypothetical protein
MLKMYIIDLLAFCKVTGFSVSSIKSLHASLKDFATFVEVLQTKTVKKIGYGNLSRFVSDFKSCLNERNKCIKIKHFNNREIIVFFSKKNK